MRVTETLAENKITQVTLLLLKILKALAKSPEKICGCAHGQMLTTMNGNKFTLFSFLL